MIRSFVAMALTVGMASSAFAMDKAYFEIKDVKVTDVTAQFPKMETMASEGDLSAECSTKNALTVKYSDKTFASGTVIDGVEVIVDQIINIGKKIFAVIAAGKPVSELTNGYGECFAKRFDLLVGSFWLECS